MKPTDDPKPDTGAPGFFVRQPPAKPGSGYAQIHDALQEEERRQPPTAPMTNDEARNYVPGEVWKTDPLDPTAVQAANALQAQKHTLPGPFTPATAPSRILGITIYTEDGLSLRQEIKFNSLDSPSQRQAIWDTIEELNWGISAAENARGQTTSPVSYTTPPTQE